MRRAFHLRHRPLYRHQSLACLRSRRGQRLCTLDNHSTRRRQCKARVPQNFRLTRLLIRTATLRWDRDRQAHTMSRANPRNDSLLIEQSHRGHHRVICSNLLWIWRNSGGAGQEQRRRGRARSLQGGCQAFAERDGPGRRRPIRPIEEIKKRKIGGGESDTQGHCELRLAMQS